MLPPKYRFYIGTQSVPTSVSNHYIENDGTTSSAANAYSSNIINIASNAQFLYLSLPYDAKRDSGSWSGDEQLYSFSFKIVFYDDNNVAISYVVSTKSSLIEIPKKATKYAISGAYIVYDLSGMIKTWLEDGIVYFAINSMPHYKNLSKKFAKENGQEFFRTSLDGNIKVYGASYDYISNSDLEDSMAFFILKLNTISDEWIEYFKGSFSKTDCTINHSSKSCELNLTSLDRYTKIMDAYDNTYDLVKLKPEITKINLYKRSLVQVYIRGADSISNYFGGTYWEDDVNEAIDSDSDLKQKYYFAYVGAGNEFYIEGVTSEPGINGVYAGINGEWTNWNGYTCYFATSVATKVDEAYIEIKRDSDGEILFRSAIKWVNTNANNCYINGENKVMVNVNNSNDTFTIKSPFVYHIYQRMLCDVDTLSDGTATYDLPTDDFVVDNRNYKKCIGLVGGNFFCTSKTSTEPTKYGLNDYNEYFTDDFLPSFYGAGRLLPICRSTWANASLWYAYTGVLYETWEEGLRKKYILNDSYSIAAIIKALLAKIDPSLSHEATAEYSQFLYGSPGVIMANRFYVFLTQKTNILKGQYDQAAQKAETTLKDMMDMLRDCFRCYWFIEDNKFKVEHISYFMNGGQYTGSPAVQLDFTSLTDMFNKKLTSYYQTEIEYDKSDLNSRYEFNWMDDVTEIFGPVNVDVKSNYVQKDKTEEINISSASSDIDFMLFNPSNFSDDGFALMCAIKNGGTYELPIINATLYDDDTAYSTMAQNWYASWPYLISNFYMSDMPASNIEADIVKGLYVTGVKKCMSHTIQFAIAEDLDEVKLIKTALGNGTINEISINLDTRLAKVDLIYTPM